MLSTSPMSSTVHRSSWMTFCGGLMSSSPPVEPHQAVLSFPLLLVMQDSIMGCLAGITAESLKCLHKPVRDTFSQSFGRLSSPVKGFVAKLTSAGLLA